MPKPLNQREAHALNCLCELCEKQRSDLKPLNQKPRVSETLKEVRCTEPIPMAGNVLCNQVCYAEFSEHSQTIIWKCPSHGLEKIERIEYNEGRKV